MTTHLRGELPSQGIELEVGLGAQITQLVQEAKVQYVLIGQATEIVTSINAELYKKLVTFVEKQIEANTSLTSDDRFYGGYSILYSSDNGSSTNLWVFFKPNVDEDLKNQLFQFAINDLGKIVSLVLSGTKILRINTKEYGISIEIQYPESIKQ